MASTAALTSSRQLHGVSRVLKGALRHDSALGHGRLWQARDREVSPTLPPPLQNAKQSGAVLDQRNSISIAKSAQLEWVAETEVVGRDMARVPAMPALEPSDPRPALTGEPFSRPRPGVDLEGSSARLLPAARHPRPTTSVSEPIRAAAFAMLIELR